MIKYDKFWKTMKQRGISQYALIHVYHFSAGQLSRIKHNEYLSTKTIDKICDLLECRVEDVMEHLPDKKADLIRPAAGQKQQDSLKTKSTQSIGRRTIRNR